jgi:hypothetical protein
MHAQILPKNSIGTCCKEQGQFSCSHIRNWRREHFYVFQGNNFIFRIYILELNLDQRDWSTACKMSVRSSLLCVVLLVCSCVNSQDKDKLDSCTVQELGAARLESPDTNATCGTVEGRVQVCEEQEWRFLCDSNWTVQDAAVACRSLNLSTRGRSEIFARQ